MADNIWHVLPNNDVRQHIEECAPCYMNGIPVCACACRPVTHVEEAGFIIVHNSFDGREGVEWVNEILKQ